MLEILMLLGGIGLLVKGSDFFVETSSRLAKKLGVSEFVIGLTLVAIGTSIPEIATSIIASINDQSQILIGNIIGTNIANITLIIGLTAVLYGINTSKNMLKRDGYIMVFASLILLMLLIIGEISMISGMILIILYISYVLFLLKIKSQPEIKDYHFKQFLDYFIKMEFLITIKERIIKNAIKKKTMTDGEKKALYSFKEGLVKDIFILTISIFAIYFGARFLINGATHIANLFNLSQNLIGLSVVALGTSLPELSVTLSAAKKGLGNMVVGNIMGSNIANIFLVLGLASLINPISITEVNSVIEGIILLGISLLLLIFIKSEWKIERYEGMIFILLYIAFLLMIIFSTF